MSVIKFNRNFSELFNWDSDADPTTEQEYQNAVRNWTEVEMDIVDTLLWQPETAYSVGNIAKTPSLPSQYILVCTEAGDSGVTEPDYTGVGVGDTVVDGTATWLVSTIANGGNIDALTTAVEANTQAIGEHSTAITTNTQNISTNTADIATNAENIATNASDIANNATDIEIADKRISNIEKLLQGNLYDYQTDSTEAYTKTVPAGAMPYAGLEKLGGKTIVWNQLVVMDNVTSVRNGITYTITSDGTVVINGTSTAIADSAPTAFSTNPTIGHVYWLRGSPADSSASTYYINTNNGACYADGLRFTANSSTSRVVHIRVESGVTANNVTFKIQCTDLTLMFGAGNEPTLDECKAMFPAESYPYNAGTLLSAGVTEVVSKKADTTTIATYPIPAEIQALEGYGWSAGSVYNYVDFERKVFVKNVGAVDCGKQSMDLTSLGFRIRLPNDSRSVLQGAQAVCSKYPTFYGDSVNYKATQREITVSNSSITGVKCALVNDDNYTTIDEFKAAMNGVYLYYELETPVETDISAYLADDNLIEVEAGGTLTFPNSNGDNYRIPIPSEETYMINLQEAVSNG